MKRFRFGAERLLLVRRLAQKQKAASLRERLIELWRAEENLNAAHVRCEHAGRELVSAQHGARRAGELQELAQFWGRARLRRHAEGERFREAKMKAEREREEYAESRKDVRAIERLREKRRRGYAAEVAREEQADADEGVVLRWRFPERR